MVLGKLKVPGRPANMDYGRARAYCPCSRCGWGLFGHFFSRLSFLFSFSLSLEGGPIYTEILSQRAVKPHNNQPTNLQLCIIVGKGPTALAIGAVVIVWTFFLSSIISLFFLPLSGRRPDID